MLLCPALPCPVDTMQPIANSTVSFLFTALLLFYLVWLIIPFYLFPTYLSLLRVKKKKVYERCAKTRIDDQLGSLVGL